MKPEDLLQRLSSTHTQKCTVGCPVLDRFLGGGVPCNSITELVAESGCGKTQISLQLLLSVQLPTSLGGLSGSSLYLYSESPFPIRRLHQLSSSFPTLHTPLDKILTRPLHSAHHLFDVLSQTDSLLLSPSSLPVKLIVIDSIAALFRFEFENNPRDLKERSGLFFRISSKLKEQARRFGLAVVVINQVVDVMNDSDGLRIGNSTCLYTSERKVCAALGLSWANCVNTRLFLSRQEERIAQQVIGDDDCFSTQTRRFVRVAFAPHLPDSYSKGIEIWLLCFASKRVTAVTVVLVFASLAIDTQSVCEDKGNSFSNLKVIAEKGLQVFTFKQLHSATGGFGKSNVIGHGAFGSVYRGVLQDGRKVAIKLMDQAGKQGEDEFKVEVELLCRLRSPYLLSLIGYCSESSHKLLVYEFMANGGLQEHLYPIKGSNNFCPKLDWKTRLRIALEAAKGLEYLHEHVNPPVIHRDLKSSNILLDKNFHAKVSDFGLAKLGSDKAGGHVSTRVLGTQGYVAPEYALTGHLTTKSDVYSYGVVLLELLTGRVPVDMKRSPGEGVLVSWALPRLTDREKVVEIMDPALEGQYSMKEVIQVAAIAAMCVQPEADYRPLMADVVQSLVPLVKQPRPTVKPGSSSSLQSPHATQSPKA